MTDVDQDQPGADELPKTSVQKTLEVVEQLASESGGSPVAAFLIPLVKQRLPSDPEELDAQLAKYAQVLLMMRSDNATITYTITPSPFQGETPDAPSLPAAQPC